MPGFANRLLTGGWIPAGLVGLVILSLWLGSGVRLWDIASFTAYAVFALVLPGTLLWRLLRPRAPRLWLEDVVLGAILGYAVEIVCYLLARAAGVPLLVLIWPAAVYLVSLLTPRGRGLWRPQETTPVGRWWAWLVAAASAYLVLFVARANWWSAGLSPRGLRVIGPDASFQLALTGELRHHVPPAIPWVSGEPLHYHWLTYVHTAASSWVTAIEPIVLLRRFSPTLMMLLIVLAVALISTRIAKRDAAGPLAAGLLVIVHSPAFAPAETDHFQRQEFTSQAIFGSPTMTFGSLLFCGVLYIVCEVLAERPPPVTWVLLALFVAVTSGAKATFAPMLVAGALTVVLVGLLTRSISRRALGLLALTTASWLTFQFGFYGGESTGLRITARGTLDFAAASIGALTPSATSMAGIALATTIVVLWAVHMAGMAGLLLHGGWREPFTAFAFGFTASGIGAALLLDLGLFSQQWFVCSTQVMVAVAAACGFSRLVPSERLRDLLPLAVTAALLGAAGMAVGWAMGDAQVPSLGPSMSRLWDYGAPFLGTLAILLVLALVFSTLPSPAPRLVVAVLFLSAGLTGLGLFRTTQLSVALAQLPWEQPPLPPARKTTVGAGGVEAARWLRAHSAPDDLVATNGHTLTPSDNYQLAFWLAGYAERRILVESWGYTPRHASIMATTGLEFDEVPFWDATRLVANDAAFTSPDEKAVSRLRDDYGVTWLVLDRRFPAEPEVLSRNVSPSFSQGDYIVYRIS